MPAGCSFIGGAVGNPRYSNGSRRRKIRSRLLAYASANGLPCAICGRPIDYTLSWWVDPADGKRKRHPLSFEVDEIVPVSKGGSPYEWENVRPAHRRCNQRRGNGDPPPTKAAKVSREW